MWILQTFYVTDIIKMLIVLMENIFAMFGKLVFQPSRHSYGYHLHSLPTLCFIHMMQTSCKCFWSGKMKGSLNFTFHNIDGQYPFIIFRCLAIASLIEFEIENTIYTARPSSYLNQPIEIYSEGRFGMVLCHKRSFQFSYWNFHLYVATFQLHLHMEYEPLNCYYIPELMFPW